MKLRRLELPLEVAPSNTMATTLKYGNYAGKTLEWIFFHAPWYAMWIYENRIYRQAHWFNDEERWEFLELYRRAWSITGTCSMCRARPFIRMGVSTHHGKLGFVIFCCEDCEYTCSSPLGYYRPALFVAEYTPPRCDQLVLTNVIKEKYIGYGRLTQAKMEEFFHNDANFAHAKAGFFEKKSLAGID